MEKNEVYDFWSYVIERQKIWFRKEILKKNPPWTENKILQKYRFCNDFRELDKGTKYLIEELHKIKNTVGKSQEKKREMILFNVVAYRFFNSNGFFQKIGGLLDPEKYNAQKFIKILDELIEKKEKIYNPAYVVCPLVIKNEREKDKHAQIAFILEILRNKLEFKSINKSQNFLEKIDKCSKPEQSLEILKEIPAVSNFLGYEIWTDLSYFNDVPFFKQNWNDNDFVNLGPGAIWGLNILNKEDKKGKLFSKEEYLEMAFSLRDNMKNDLEEMGLLKEWLEISFKGFENQPFLSIRNIEHSLWEYRKYWRLKNNRKGRKRYYQ